IPPGTDPGYRAALHRMVTDCPGRITIWVVSIALAPPSTGNRRTCPSGPRRFTKTGPPAGWGVAGGTATETVICGGGAARTGAGGDGRTLWLLVNQPEPLPVAGPAIAGGGVRRRAAVPNTSIAVPERGFHFMAESPWRGL